MSDTSNDLCMHRPRWWEYIDITNSDGYRIVYTWNKQREREQEIRRWNLLFNPEPQCDCSRCTTRAGGAR